MFCFYSIPVLINLKSNLEQKAHNKVRVKIMHIVIH